MARNRYQEIMAQYQQAQPFSFFGYPSTYSGGYSSTPAPAAPVTRYEEIMQQPAMRMGGGGFDREQHEAYMNEVLHDYGDGTLTRNAYWSLPSDERAALNEQYAKEHPIKYAIGEGLKWALIPGYGWFTKLADGLSSMGYDSSSTGGPARYTSPPVVPNVSASNLGLTANPMAMDPAQQGQQLANRITEQDRANARDSGGEGGSYGGGGDGAEGRGEPGGDRGGWGRGGGYALGGHVSSTQLQGPNPPGPDDGYGALKGGEYVINDKAVSKYGIDLMHAINSGRISKGKLRGLLEM